MLSEDRRNPLKSERLPEQSGTPLLRDSGEAFLGGGQQAYWHQGGRPTFGLLAQLPPAQGKGTPGKEWTGPQR